jgi:cobalt-zinc-cadmium efflux system outer membrane protein
MHSLFRAGAVAVGLAIPWISVSAQQSATLSDEVQTLTLGAALQIAETSNATLRARQAEVDAAQGAHSEARSPLFNNPQLSADRTRREVPQSGLAPTERRREWGAGISQTLEIAGQQGLRRDTASATLTAVQEDIEATRREVRADVAQQFYRVLGLQERITIEEQAVRLFEGTATAVRKRRSVGEDTRLDANLAAVESERSRNQLSLLQEQRADAAAELGRLMQSKGSRLQVNGDLERDLMLSMPTLDELLASSMSQPRLRSFLAKETAAKAKLGLERASRYPDVTLGVNVGREGSMDARERLTTVTLSVPLPLFKRNQAAIGRASTDLTQAQIDRESATRDAENQVRVLWSRLQSLKQRVQRLKGSVLPTLADNEQLSLKSQRAGEIGLLELIVVNRQTHDARRDLIEALVDFQTTRIALELAAGRVPAADQGASQ